MVWDTHSDTPVAPGISGSVGMQPRHLQAGAVLLQGQALRAQVRALRERQAGTSSSSASYVNQVFHFRFNKSHFVL